jgi:hypothetical protein
LASLRAFFMKPLISLLFTSSPQICSLRPTQGVRGFGQPCVVSSTFPAPLLIPSIALYGEC